MSPETIQNLGLLGCFIGIMGLPLALAIVSGTIDPILKRLGIKPRDRKSP